MQEVNEYIFKSSNIKVCAKCYVVLGNIEDARKASRSRHQRCSMKKGNLRNFTKFTGKLLCQSLFLNKVAGLRLATLLKKRALHRWFPVNFVKFLRATFLENTSGRLLLDVV